MTRVLIAGVSTRAAAASAARAGFAVTAIDGYADRDQHPAVRALSLPRDARVTFTPAAAAVAADGIRADAVVYLSNIDNDPDAVTQLSRGRQLWGNPPDILRRARDPFAVRDVFRTYGLPTPRLRNAANPNDPNDPNDANAPNDWLLKPLCSGGGHGIRPWRPGDRVRPGHYLQQRITGTPGSVVFVAASGSAVVLGVSRQLIGDARFGGHGYRYCGNILAPATDPQFDRGDALMRSAGALASVAASDLGLIGVNGIDFVARAGVPYPVEVNPRWSASMELVERACGVNVFAAHATACTGSELPSFNRCAAASAKGHDAPPQATSAVGKAIVFARHPVVIGNTDDWLNDPDIRDVPHAGDAIAAGSPVCTVFASAPDAAGCELALVARAAAIYEALAQRPDPAAVSVTSLHDSPFTARD